jgi:CheY-like chemotaxis protein
LGSLKLLIVEDDAPTLELMAEVFTSLQAEVVPLIDSKKAAALVQHERFDGIFLDLEMPHLDGFELTRQIRETSWNKSTPIIIVTAREDRQTMHRAFETGATFFVQKPVDTQRLIRLFRTARGALFETRRRSLRIPLQTEVLMDIGARRVKGVAWNLSQGGMQVEASNLRIGDSLHLSFRLPGSGATIEATAKVAWTESNRQGIQFTRISPENQALIREFVADAAREPDK